MRYSRFTSTSTCDCLAVLGGRGRAEAAAARIINACGMAVATADYLGRRTCAARLVAGTSGQGPFVASTAARSLGGLSSVTGLAVGSRPSCSLYCP